MNWFLIALAVWMMIMLAGCGPSCEEQGGKLRIIGVVTTVIMSGNVPIPINSPIYECEVPDVT